MAPAKLQPALLGGLAMGVLSALPIISVANCCCLWILFGGGLASYLMQQNHPEPITAGDGAIAGLLAGVIGAVVWSALSIPIGMMMGPFQAAFFERMLENARDVPPEVRAIIESMRGSGFALGVGAVATFFALAFIGVFIGAIFGAIGGMLGAVMFRKNVPPPPPPMMPPPVPPVPGTV
jgi:hypothetical protein